MNGAEQERTLALAASGDRGAMGALWNRHRPWVAAVVLSHGPGPEELDDVLQEIAMTVVQRLHEVREAVRFEGWLRTVAINAARTAGRRVRARPAASDEGLNEIPAATRDCDGHERLLRVLNATRRLDDTAREVLLLRAVRGLSQRKIATILNLPESTVESRLARARQRLREHLEQEERQERDRR